MGKPVKYTKVKVIKITEKQKPCIWLVAYVRDIPRNTNQLTK